MSSRFGAAVIVPLVTTAAVAGIAMPAGGMNLYAYDLDSLTYMAEHVVEGDVTRSDSPAGAQANVRVRVIASYGGGLAAGQDVIVEGMYLYRKTNGPLTAGDRLFFFLVRDREIVPRGDPMFSPVPDGLKLVVADEVYGFSQRSNPGPYECDMRPSPDNPPPEPAGDFRNAIKASETRVTGWRRHLVGPSGVDAIPSLLSILKARAPIATASPLSRDAIATDASIRLANLHDPPSLYEALGTSPSELPITARGFGTPEGRDCLVSKVTEGSLPVPQRARVAAALADAGDIYRSRFRNITSAGYQAEGTPDYQNSLYLTKIAKAIDSVATEDRLAIPLLTALQRYASQSTSRRSSEVQSDLDQAALVLERTYLRIGLSEQTRYRIETVMVAIGPAAYERLRSKCGPVPAIAFLADLARVGGPVSGTIGVGYEVNWTTKATHVDAVCLVMEPLGKGSPYVLATRAAAFRHVSQLGDSGFERVVLPENLAAGRYRIFFRLFEANKVVGESHCFEATL
jgi:hypothetical protein